jgi:DNA-binding XRE family transcriptional regulator
MYPRLRDRREDRDLNQTQVAKMLGMSQTGYSKYETGENDIASEYERSWNPPATPNKNRIGHVFTHPMRPILSRQRTVPRLASISYLI